MLLKKNFMLSLLTLATISVLSASAIANPTSVPTEKTVLEISANQKIAESDSTPQRFYVVKNENGFLIALSDAELDKPAEITRLGNAKTIVFKDKILAVESTIILREKQASMVDRYMATTDSNDE